MKIEINIETQLESILKKIGLDDDEIDNEYAIISQKIQDLFITILSDFSTISDNLEKKVEYLESKAIRYNRLIGRSDDSVQIDITQPLKIRYEQANQQLYEFKKTFATRASNYSSLYELLTNLFDILEIPLKDRGIFKEKGTDVSVEKIEEAGNLVFEFKEAVDIRQRRMDNLIKELNELHTKLRLKPVEIPRTLGNSTFQQYENELNYLNDVYQNCIQEKKKAINQIHQIEDFFSIESPSFVIESEKSENLSYCDEEELDHLLKYLNELQKEKTKQIPEFIEKEKQIIFDLYQELHIQIPSIQEFPALYYRPSSNSKSLNYNVKGNDLKDQIESKDSLYITEKNNLFLNGNFDVLNELDAKIENLTKFKEETEVIRNYLLQRDRILNISKKRPKKNLSFNQVVAYEKMITVDLPIINIQLEPLLEDYEKNNQTPFLWEGNDVLSEIKLQNSNFKERTGMVHKRYVTSISNSKK